MNQTLIALALVTIAGSAMAQPAGFPAANSTPLTPPSVPAGSPTTASGLPPAMGAPAEITSRYGYGAPGVADTVAPPLASGSAAAPGAAEAPTPTPGDNPGARAPSVAALANAPGSEAAIRSIQADGYRNVQGLARGADGKWHGRALRGATLVDVSVDGRGNVTSP